MWVICGSSQTDWCKRLGRKLTVLYPDLAFWVDIVVPSLWTDTSEQDGAEYGCHVGSTFLQSGFQFSGARR
ncbi:predicted protein [Botrytis cinerea T4]|uniref:Uncharacterized protein n=1 Tax=Botryotinia fuckeliana (strain T4) TaxID=999810 RepID=G2XST2_BOTF4|nr:predicted protein [Botrytis cinerea T4]